MKGTAKILVIISMVTGALSGLSALLMSDVVLELFKEILQQLAAELGTISFDQFLDIFKTGMIITGAIEIVGALAVGIYALWALKNGKNKRALIAPGVLLIIFGNIFGIIAAIMMFCVKPEEFEEAQAEVVQ